ncbi:sigma-70 family RNA polymerase sigma factor [Polyangium sp. 15x6]|uniref:RNA polymerase sigma factor n=1 Tax=Polyangium sp. 15x6 TaxID=3042687 RepID=UPI00249AC6B8|nr:sigma-70 family RNA polymerase sigma factor [Polyangium sp. 15x6]MDI3290997.1 sigma-70 family RNA polymerase sigma factor [Polyangium sp. 15x6]
MSREFHQGAPLDELIARAKAGDRSALEALFQWCQPVLDDWVSRRLAKKQAGIARASDIAQEAGMQAFRSFAAFQGTTEKQFLAWLQKVVETSTTQAFRHAGQMKRDKKEETPLDDPDALEIPAPQTSPSQATAAAEQWQLVFGWIFQLPEEQKLAIWLCHLKEMRVAAAAEQMGKSEQAVAGLLQRGIRTLRERMSNEMDGKSAVPSAGPTEQEEAAAALLSYLRRRDAGERVDAAAFVAEHPSSAAELRTMLEWIERIQALRPTDLDE